MSDRTPFLLAQFAASTQPQKQGTAWIETWTEVAVWYKVHSRLLYLQLSG